MARRNLNCQRADIQAVGQDKIWYGFTFIDEFGGLSPDNILSLGIYRRMQLEDFKIVEKYVTENRGYEGELEKYLSEHPEDEELDFDGQLKKAGIKIPEPETFEFIFIFDDGKFIEQN